MYNKKYRLVKLEANRHNPCHNDILNKICYLAYLNIGERGWFLCDTQEGFESVHRFHTSLIEDIQYIHNDYVIVTTQNTKYTFKREI